MKISAIIITRNEEKNIVACLESLSWVDEIVVVDDFSTDSTPELCRTRGVSFFSNAFKGFRDQKSYAMSCATNEWILEIDADERVSQEMQASIQALTLEHEAKYACFFFSRLTLFWGRWIRHSSLYPDLKGRLYHRSRGRWSDANIHERFIPDGPTKRLEGDILHEQDLTLESYVARTLRYSSLSAREYLAAGKRTGCLGLLLRPLYTFVYRFFLRRGFLDGIHGLVIAAVGALGTFAKYGILYELQRRCEDGKETVGSDSGRILQPQGRPESHSSSRPEESLR